MAILTESYSAGFLLKHLEGKRMELQREQQAGKSRINDASEDLRYEDRMIKINNVLSTNPKYIEKYDALQELITDANKLKERVNKISEAINKLQVMRSEEDYKGQFEDLVIHLSLSDRVVYDLTEGSDLHAV